MAKQISSRPPSLRQRLAGFTIVELLVVILILGLLMSLLLPAIQAVRAAGQRTVCLNNLREIGLSTQIYVTTKDCYPPAYDNRTNPVHRWMDCLTPYLNKGMAVYWCPADPNRTHLSEDSQIILSYGVNVFNFTDNAHCFWYYDPLGPGGVRSCNVKHPRQVILYADCISGTGNYYCGSGSVFNDPVPFVAYRHPGNAFNAVYCDGHAESRTTTTQTDWDASQ